MSLLYELSENKDLSEKIGSVPGAILILVGLSSSKVENLLIVDRAEKTLENLENSEKNVRQMAENGRLPPLLRLLLEGTFVSYIHFLLTIILVIYAVILQLLGSDTLHPVFSLICSIIIFCFLLFGKPYYMVVVMHFLVQSSPLNSTCTHLRTHDV